MADVQWRQVTFTYPGAARPALEDVNISVKQGEFVVLCGSSGSGKSTLLRLLKRELSPGGTVSGEILVGGVPVERMPAREAARSVGLVLQHPDNQLVVDTVEHELAFGMENFGIERQEMRRRMAEMAGFFGLEPLLDRSTDQLSGGQKQTVNLAAVLMLQPRVLLLDEPLAQLDPLAARELLGMIRRLNEEWGITVLLSEHRLDELLPAADRIVRLDAGRVVFDGPPAAFARDGLSRGDDAYLPAVTRWAWSRIPDAARENPPLTIKEARRWIAAHGSFASQPSGVDAPYAGRSDGPSPEARSPAASGAPLLTASELFFAYDKREPAVLRGLTWSLNEGDFAVLFGGNGSGKSTLLQLLAGLRDPQRGRVLSGGTPLDKLPAREQRARIGYLAQNPVLHFAHDTLGEDLRQAARQAGHADPEAAARHAAERFGLTALADRHPHDLSGGEQQLGALAIVLMSRPRALLLDEPTKGLDPRARSALADTLEQLSRAGTTLLVATHDVEFAASCASRCSLLFGGEIVADGPPERFFPGNLFYATALDRLLAEGRPRTP